MFYYHNGIKLEVNSNKILSHKKLNDTHLNNLSSQKINHRQTRKYSQLNYNEITTYQNL